MNPANKATPEANRLGALEDVRKWKEKEWKKWLPLAALPAVLLPAFAASHWCESLGHSVQPGFYEVAAQVNPVLLLGLFIEAFGLITPLGHALRDVRIKAKRSVAQVERELTRAKHSSKPPEETEQQVEQLLTEHELLQQEVDKVIAAGYRALRRELLAVIEVVVVGESVALYATATKTTTTFMLILTMLSTAAVGIELTVNVLRRLKAPRFANA